MRLTLLGTGTSFGVPQIGCDCAVCHSADPRDRRHRTAALIETAGGNILIDTPPELRLGLLTAKVADVEEVPAVQRRPGTQARQVHRRTPFGFW